MKKLGDNLKVADAIDVYWSDFLTWVFVRGGGRLQVN